MDKKSKILCFLRDAGGSVALTQVHNGLFSKNSSVSEQREMLNTFLLGLVVVKNKKWGLTKAGWREANQIGAANIEPAQQEATPDDFQRFKDLAENNPDCTPQRLLQLSGRHVGDPLTWGEEWRSAHPEWFLQQPKDWYSRDVELDADGYPLRLPESPLTAKERESRPNSEQGWFEHAVRQPGASLEPLAVEMPAYEVANVMRVCKKIGLANARDIFGPEKIATAHRLAGIENASK